MRYNLLVVLSPSPSSSSSVKYWFRCTNLRRPSWKKDVTLYCRPSRIPSSADGRMVVEIFRIASIRASRSTGLCLLDTSRTASHSLQFEVPISYISLSAIAVTLPIHHDADKSSTEAHCDTDNRSSTDTSLSSGDKVIADTDINGRSYVGNSTLRSSKSRLLTSCNTKAFSSEEESWTDLVASEERNMARRTSDSCSR